MTTAQETYQAMVRDDIAPRLRELGFRGSRSVYSLPDDHYWRLLGFQRSVSSNRERVSFTLNLTLADKAAWQAALQTHAWIGSRPSGNVGAYGLPPEIVEVARIGELIPGKDDVWWELPAGGAAEPLASEVLDAIETYGLPWLRRKSPSTGSQSRTPHYAR